MYTRHKRFIRIKAYEKEMSTRLHSCKGYGTLYIYGIKTTLVRHHEL